MRIPDSFKAAQRQAFQDKQIEHYKAREIKGNLGSVTREPEDACSGVYSVNVQVVNDALIAQEYGLTIGKSIIVTSSDNLPISKGDYVRYNGCMYLVKETPTYDAYMKLFAEALP